MTHKYTFYVIATAAILAMLIAMSYSALKVGATDAGTIPATIAVATTTTVGPQQNIQLFAEGRCSSRIVSTLGVGIMLSFADPKRMDNRLDLSSTTLSGVKGHWQGASTTVAYDAGLFGCGNVFGYAGASTTISVVDAR